MIHSHDRNRIFFRKQVFDGASRSIARIVLSFPVGLLLLFTLVNCGIGHNALGTFNGTGESSTDLLYLALLLSAPSSDSSGTNNTQIAGGREHSCYLSAAGTVRCWGLADRGQLGYGNTNNIGDDESPASAGDVNVGGTVTQIAAGAYHTCALLNTGSVRCWGENTLGQLGYGNTNNIGDDETP
ncbi:MAG: hypothetical protein KDK27_10985, partial [Leptospiraceae bacterium]|nr:hypothetical protein [Leptospiraceae bacterium]